MDSVNENIGVVKIVDRGLDTESKNLIKREVLSVEEYRKILNDNESSEEQIRQRIIYLESFCRNTIRGTLEGFMKTTV